MVTAPEPGQFTVGERVSVDIPPLAERLSVRDVSAPTAKKIGLVAAFIATLVLFVLLFALAPRSLKPPEGMTPSAVMALLGVACAGGVFTGAWIWAEASVARVRGKTSRWMFLATYAVGGALVGVLLEILLPLAGYESTTPALVRILSIAAVAPWMAAIIGATYDGRQRIKAARSLLVKQASEIAFTSASQATLVEELRSRLHEELGASLQPVIARTEERLAFEATFVYDRVTSTAINVLEELTDTSIRRLSRGLTEHRGITGERRGLLTFVTGVARHQSFRPASVAGIFLLTVVADRWTTEGFNSALISACVGVPLIFAILWSGNGAMEKWPRHHAFIFVTTFLILQIPMIIGTYLDDRALTWAFVGQMLLTSFLSGCIVWLTSGIGQWRRPQTELLRVYADELNNARIEMLVQAEILRSLTKEAARVLHGSVQSKLLACILALDQAAGADDALAHAKAIANARAIVAQPWLGNVGEPQRSTLQVLVDEKVALWQGLAGITSIVAPNLKEHTGVAAEQVATIVEEALCNAIRHGSADTISVQIDFLPEEGSGFARVRVVDDGTGLKPSPPGLGSALLDEICQGRWVIHTNDQGGCLVDAWVVVSTAGSPTLPAQFTE